ncbi:MAG: metallophosphoesterase, partial [Tistlia sp.]
MTAARSMAPLALRLCAVAFLAGLLGAVPVARAAPPEGGPMRLTLVTTNDLDRMEEKDGRGGLARLAAVVEAERARNGGAVLFLHAGDAFSPSVLSAFDEGAHMVALLNMIRPDAFVPGNHEFDFGPDAFAARIAEADFPVLAANLRSPAGTLPDGVLTSQILKVAGMSVGIVGVMLDDVSERSTPGGYSFLPPLPIAEEIAETLREKGAEVVVA